MPPGKGYRFGKAKKQGKPKVAKLRAPKVGKRKK